MLPQFEELLELDASLEREAKLLQYATLFTDALSKPSVSWSARGRSAQLSLCYGDGAQLDLEGEWELPLLQSGLKPELVESLMTKLTVRAHGVTEPLAAAELQEGTGSKAASPVKAAAKEKRKVPSHLPRQTAHSKRPRQAGAVLKLKQEAEP